MFKGVNKDAQKILKDRLRSVMLYSEAFCNAKSYSSLGQHSNLFSLNRIEGILVQLNATNALVFSIKQKGSREALSLLWR